MVLLRVLRILRILRALRVKLSGWVGLFPDPPFTGLCRKLFAGGLKFWVVGQEHFSPDQANRTHVGLKMSREGVEGSERIRAKWPS